MTTYTTLSNALVAVGAKPFATTVQALRDNPLAIAESDSTAPVVRAHWHPYNMVTNGDGSTGLIYNSAVDGSVATVTTPDFVDGYEYMMELIGVNVTATTGTIAFNLWRETSGAYDGGVSLFPGTASISRASGRIELPRVRSTQQSHVYTSSVDVHATGDTTRALTPRSFVVTHNTSQKILRARLTPSANFTTGLVYLYRRRAIY